MSYPRWNKPSLAEQQAELQVWIEERLKSESVSTRQRVCQWLSNNGYFIDNELFDFYLSVAQNIAAVEVLGGSGTQLLRAKAELDDSARYYAAQVINTTTQMTQQTEHQLQAVVQSHSQIEQKLDEVLAGLAAEHQHQQAIATELVRSSSTLLAKQKQMLFQTEAARKRAFDSVILAWAMPLTALLIWGVLALYGKL